MNRLACLLLSVSACASVSDDQTDADDPITITDGTADARGVLRVANELTFQELDIDVGLPSNAATQIVAHRTYDTIARLDAVPYVGPSAFTKLLAYAKAHGYVTSRIEACSGAVYPGPVVCGDEHWSFDRPTPSGQTLHGAVTFSAHDVWAVGNGGTVMHYDGASWKTETSPVCEQLNALWGTSATNLWAVGASGRILHRTSSGWTVIESGGCDYLKSVWGSPSGTIWIAGIAGMYRGDAHGFTIDTTERMDAVFGFSDSDVWAVGSGWISHYDGAAWTNTDVGNYDFQSIWGADPDHLAIGGFAWGSDETAVWNFSESTAATPVMTLLSGNRTATVGGTSATDMWMVGDSGNMWRYDGTKWSFTGTGTTDEINSIAMLSPSEGWAVGEGGQRLHWNGTNWFDDVGAQHGFSSTFALSPSDIWASSYNSLWHYDGTTWSTAAVTGFYNDVWASSANDVYGVGLDVRHFDGHTWSVIAMPIAAGFLDGGWFAVDGSGPNDVWIGGANRNYTGKLAHWDGSTWTAVSFGLDKIVRDIYVAAANNIWVATDGGLVHFDGSLWSVAGPLNTGKLNTVRGIGSHIWATGTGGVYHFDGSTWSRAVSNASTSTEFRGVAGTGANDVWVATSGVLGNWSQLLHWDGTAWTTHVNPTSGIITGIEKTDRGVIAVDTSGSVLRLH